MTRVLRLHITRHNKETIQERLMSLISFCFKFTGVQVCHKLSK